jgi:heme A synthase
MIRRFAQITCALTYCLVLLGGLVHNTRSSLACPDWPLCFGQVFPKMEGGVLVEHSHRLLASTVGLCTLTLMILLLRRKPRGLGALGVVAFCCVLFQGLLGGVTVLYRLPTLVSTTHLAVSMLFFSILLYIIWQLEPVKPRPLPAPVRQVTLIAAVGVYLQMILGAFMRHLGAGLSCTDVPFCADGVWPRGAHGAIQLHAAHRLGGIAVFALVLFAAIVTFRAARGRTGLRLLALVAPLLVVAQIVLGLWSVTSFLDVVPVTLHLALAAALLADLVYLHLRARRVAASLPAASAPEGALAA